MRHGCHAVILALVLTGVGCLSTPEQSNANADAGAPDVGDTSGDVASPDAGDDTGGAADQGDDPEPCDGACSADHCIDDECVECIESAECDTIDQSLCDPDTNTCVSCDGSSDSCAKFADATVCDADDGTCVECTGEDYAACGGVCDSRQRSCTSRPAGEIEVCGACVSDAECGEGMYCVAMSSTTSDTAMEAEVGTFCLWDIDSDVEGAPDGACGNVRPYIGSVDVTSVDGVEVTVCAPRETTCAGLDTVGDDCETAGVDDDCGAPGFADASCVEFDTALNSCTTDCSIAADCPGDRECGADMRCEL